jgi:hypothetical protein
MGSQVFLPATDSLSPVDLEAELVRLRRALPHGPSRTRLAMRRLQEGQALRLGRQGSALAVGQLAQLMGHVQAIGNKVEEASLQCVPPSSRPSAPLVRGHPPD